MYISERPKATEDNGCLREAVLGATGAAAVGTTGAALCASGAITVETIMISAPLWPTIMGPILISSLETAIGYAAAGPLGAAVGTVATPMMPVVVYGFNAAAAAVAFSTPLGWAGLALTGATIGAAGAEIPNGAMPNQEQYQANLLGSICLHSASECE